MSQSNTDKTLRRVRALALEEAAAVAIRHGHPDLAERIREQTDHAKAAECGCLFELGDSPCPVHASCEECGELYSHTPTCPNRTQVYASRPLRVYIASSWRNEHYPAVCEAVRAAGFAVQDWRSGEGQLPRWTVADPTYEGIWTAEKACAALQHPRVRRTYEKDMALLQAADAVVLLTPCGRSAHFEAGWAQGHGRPGAVLCTNGTEPELMTCGLTPVASIGALIAWLQQLPTP